MLDILGALGGGTITGIVGSIMGAITSYKMKKLEIEEKKLQQEFELAKIKAEAEAAKIEAEANIKITESIAEGEEQVLNAQAFIEAQKQERKKIFSNNWIEQLFNVDGYIGVVAKAVGIFIALLFAFCDAIKALIRPLLAASSFIVSSVLAYKAYQIVNSTTGISPADAIEVFRLSVISIIYVTMSAVSFYFADRRLGKIMDKYIGNIKNA